LRPATGAAVVLFVSLGLVTAGGVVVVRAGAASCAEAAAAEKAKAAIVAKIIFFIYCSWGECLNRAHAAPRDQRLMEEGVRIFRRRGVTRRVSQTRTRACCSVRRRKETGAREKDWFDFEGVA
jgi:hypothetical protein